MFTSLIETSNDNLLTEKYIYKILEFEKFIIDNLQNEILFSEDYIYKNFKKKYYNLISTFINQCFLENKDDVIIRFIKTIIRDSRENVYYAFKRLKILYLIKDRDKLKKILQYKDIYDDFLKFCYDFMVYIDSYLMVNKLDSFSSISSILETNDTCINTLLT